METWDICYVPVPALESSLTSLSLVDVILT